MTVLALRALGLGDALTGIPALRGLRRAFPGHRLVLAAPAALGEWLVRLGVVDDVLPAAGLQPLDWRGPPPIAVNLHGCGPQSHRVLQQLDPVELVGFRCAAAGHDAGPEWRADEHEVLRWCRLVTELGGACGPGDLRLPDLGPRSEIVVLHPGAASAARRWPLPRWIDLARSLLADGHRVEITGSGAEQDLCAELARSAPGAVNTAGQLDLDELAALVGRARLLVCGDTGVAHLATAYATPSVLLFGPTPPRRWGPAIDADLHTVLWPGAESYCGDPHGSVVDPVLARITPAEVLRAAQEQLAQQPFPTFSR